MTDTELSPAELRQKAFDILFRELGPKNACKFLGIPLNEGRGNYTEDRRKIFDGMTMETILAGIHAMREEKSKQASSET